MKLLKLFSLFHLNMAYSAIEVEQRRIVIEHSYWPMLRLAEEEGLPFGIEASAWTLQTINEIDHSWIETLKRLVNDGVCEFIGCGYSQIIGPLVPAEVNAANLRIGMDIYQELLGIRPKLALVNEQAFSAGLVPLYLEAGYEGLIMEWNNPALANPDWPSEWRYLPQRASAPDGKTHIPLIWNQSMAFQKFQRYVHGEIELDEYLCYLRTHKGEEVHAFPVYGNDIEVFDFRPGRYMTEAPIQGEGEWTRIGQLYSALKAEDDMEFLGPSEVLSLLDSEGAGNIIDLGTAEQPVTVKKQPKYNLLRWAITGRDDLRINTRCWQIYKALQLSSSATDTDWAELCYLWSSDFRTHITKQRWDAYLVKLESAAERICQVKPEAVDFTAGSEWAGSTKGRPVPVRNGRYLEIETDNFSVSFNCLRGLSLDSLVLHEFGQTPLIGTLHHGYFDDIRWGADYYTGHLVFESPGRHKVTDLNPVEPEWKYCSNGIEISGVIETPLGAIEKRWHVNFEDCQIKLNYRILWQEDLLGSLRLGHITLNSEAFDQKSLHFTSSNGGYDPEKYCLDGRTVNHGRAISFLISGSSGLGMTDGSLAIGDSSRRIQISTDQGKHAIIGLITHQPIQTGRWLTRVAFSALEVDDTCHKRKIKDMEFGFNIDMCSREH